MRRHATRRTSSYRAGRSGVVLICLLAAGLVAAVATAEPPELKAVIDGMADAQIIEQVDYSFLAIAYDDSKNVLYFAVKDGGHFNPAIEAVYRVPIESIDVVDVVDNAESRLERGCTVHLVAKDPSFGFGKLVRGQVAEGSFAVPYAQLAFEPTKTVDVGFFKCDHARDVQHEFRTLHKAVTEDDS